MTITFQNMDKSATLLCMNYQQLFFNLATILRPYTKLWQREVLQAWRTGEIDELYPEEFLTPLKKLTHEELYEMDCLRDYSKLEDGPLKTLLCSLRENEVYETVDEELIRGVDELPSWAFNKVKGKKQDEILIIANFLKKLRNKEGDFKHTVDIGGGVGHLSRTLAHYFGMEMISLDINSEFQEIGKNRLKKYPRPDLAKDVNFINHDFSIDLDGDENARIFCNDSFSLGLHTCGSLAVKHMQVASRNQTRGLLNFGCCYNKLEPSKHINISNYAKEIGPLELESNSLTLATRGHQSMSLEEFEQKKKVKNYRYCLQIYIDSVLGSDIDVISIGDAHKRLYAKSFSEYAISKLTENNIPINLTAQQLDELYAKNQELLEKLFFANIVRWQFGRALELYLLYDRAIMLQERGKEAKLMAFFNEVESPRNIGIWYHERKQS
ncbi:hypothetical protein C0Z22_03750 [Halobacteriovorax sp. DA5]|nr:hypothetical protein C0Z22_03750 [Halobacteriovorax sp. DA5]